MESKNQKVVNVKSEQMMLLLICAKCDSNKFIKVQVARGLLSRLGIVKSFSRSSFVLDILTTEYKI